MTITISVPAALRRECEGNSELVLSATTVRAALARLEQNNTLLYRSICDETGAVRRHINLFVNDSFLHKREGLDLVSHGTLIRRRNVINHTSLML